MLIILIILLVIVLLLEHWAQVRVNALTHECFKILEERIAALENNIKK